MKPFAVFDIETDPFSKGRAVHPFMADFYDGTRHNIFTGPDCVKHAFALMRKYKGYIYAHNGGKFDFKYLLPLLPRESSIHNIKGRIAKISFGEVEFRDSYCLLPIPLKAYGKLEIDYRKFEAEVRHLHLEEIKTYLKADCEYLYGMVADFVSEYGFGLTMAGRTFAQLKERFNIVPPKTSEHYDAKFRKYYYGGRVEFFRLGHITGTYSIYDINSAYPYAMTFPHVFGTDFICANVAPAKESILRNCFVSFVGESLGGLPFHNEEGALSFAHHSGEFHVTGWELISALKHNAVKIKRILTCHRPLNLRDFSDYVNHFYTLKKKADKGSPEETFAKLMLNSCYGRFALNPREFKDVELTEYGEQPEANDAADKAGKERPWKIAHDFPEIGKTVWQKKSEARSNAFYNVATAASITGFVRAYLNDAIQAARAPVYCDTDSLICASGQGIQTGRELGQWKLEGDIAPDSLWIAGKKLYAAKLTSGKWKCASKGVRLTPEEIQTVANGEEVSTVLDAPSFSLFGGERVIRRRVNRDDKRKRRKIAQKSA